MMQVKRNGMLLGALVALSVSLVYAAPASAVCRAEVTPTAGTADTVFTAAWEHSATSCTWAFNGVTQGDAGCTGTYSSPVGAVGTHTLSITGGGETCTSNPFVVIDAEVTEAHLLYNTNKNDHLPTLSPAEGAPAYVWQGSAFFFAKPYGSGAGSAPAATTKVVRCWDRDGSNKRHYADIGRCRRTSDNRDYEGTLGYALQKPYAGLVKMYQCKASGTYHYFPSTDPACAGIGSVVWSYGYVMPAGLIPAEANLDDAGDTTCLGRCGAGCDGFMPPGADNIYTDQCYDHDICVRDHGFNHCMWNGSFALAALSWRIQVEINMALFIADLFVDVFNMLF